MNTVSDLDLMVGALTLDEAIELLKFIKVRYNKSLSEVLRSRIDNSLEHLTTMRKGMKCN